MFLISALFLIDSCVASRTLSSLPRSGNTPYASRPTSLRPDTASALAESPSVRISVHSALRLPPAQLASSSLATDTRERLRPSLVCSWRSW